MHIDDAVAAVDALEQGEIDRAFEHFPHLHHAGPVAFEAGWSALVFRLLLGLDTIASRHGGEVAVAEIKNKFGALRVYTDYSGENAAMHDAISELLDAMELESLDRCAICGARADIDSRNYARYRVQCGAHWQVTLPPAASVSAHGRLAARALSIAAGDWRIIGAGRHRRDGLPVRADDLEGVATLWWVTDRPFVVASMLTERGGAITTPPDRLYEIETAIARTVSAALLS